MVSPNTAPIKMKRKKLEIYTLSALIFFRSSFADPQKISCSSSDFYYVIITNNYGLVILSRFRFRIFVLCRLYSLLACSHFSLIPPTKRQTLKFRFKLNFNIQTYYSFSCAWTFRRLLMQKIDFMRPCI